jgi:hypothetical protein
MTSLTTPRLFLSSLALVAMTAGLAACGDDDSTSSTDTAEVAETEGTEEEAHEIVSDAAVAAGLAETISAMSVIAEAPNSATDENVEAIFEGWEEYEGTIKQNDPDTYLGIEDALGAFKKGAAAADTAAMTSATVELGELAATYLASYPG